PTRTCTSTPSPKSAFPAGTITRFSAIFLSRRRRHTRFSRDWSSDVRSSDLHRRAPRGAGGQELPRVRPYPGAAERGGSPRSEERRVGEEGRSRGAPYH